jgi:hypothetical protein
MTDGFFDRFGLPPTKPPRKSITERQHKYEPKSNEVKPARFVGPASLSVGVRLRFGPRLGCHTVGRRAGCLRISKVPMSDRS